MKVLILGGAGDMARAALSVLADETAVSLVTVADINERKAGAIAAGLGGKFRSARADGMDRAGTVELMKQHDVSIGFVGPFYIFEKRMSEAAIEAGVGYVSICDDYDAYLEAAALDEKAREKSVKILTGFGNSPGITQMLARKGYDSMDKPRRINIAWAAGSNEDVGPTNLMHFFHIFNATTLQWLDGAEKRVRTGRGRRVVEFPPPMGKLPVYYTGHAESVSIPRNLAGLEEVTLHGGVHPPYIISIVKLFSALGLLATHRRRKAVAGFISRVQGVFRMGGVDKSVFRVDAHGEHAGKKCHRWYTGVGPIAQITSVPAVVAAVWLAEGRFDHKPGGVYSAERLLDDPDPFLDELKRRGIHLEYNE
ncbi:MAG: saccharopine dehydrogenase NADP-binding domain-containing protein [bacterium]